jgi:NMD protein affecting ribosome stability and mRNA decay
MKCSECGKETIPATTNGLCYECYAKQFLNVKEETCGTCGGTKVYIRGKHPSFDKRLICPTCAYERLERIHEMTNDTYGVAYTG